MAASVQNRLTQTNPPRGPSVRMSVEPRFTGKNYFFRALAAGDHTELHKMGVEKAAMTESGGLTGGYLVPLDYSTAMLDAWSEFSFIRPRATVVEMKSKETQVPYVNAETVQAAGTSPFFGGLLFTWGKAGGTTIPESEQSYKALGLTAHDLYGFLVASNQLVDDMGDVGEMAMARLFARATAWYEEYAFINGAGSGTSQPVGILNAPSAQKVARVIANQISGQDVSNMSGKLYPFGWTNAIWACSPTAFTWVSGINGFVPNVDPLGIEHGFAGSLMGRPLRITEKLPALGTLGDLVYFDPLAYCVGHRQNMVIDASRMGANFNTNQTLFRIWSRTGGLPLFDAGITLADASTVVSPFVLLK